VRKVARNSVALLCLASGIAGLFLPFLQGIALILLAVAVADFEAKERLLERYRHTRLGRRLWERHAARKAKDALRDGARAPGPSPQPPATGGTSSREE
jgi:uncharacterized membrane protein YbaN (DUF454 family)